MTYQDYIEYRYNCECEGVKPLTWEEMKGR